MTYLYSMISGIVSGLISAIIIFLYWQLQKPKLIISKDIAKNKSGVFDYGESMSIVEE